MRRITGTYERTTATGEEAQAFIPYPLPPADPPLVLDGDTTELLSRAEHKRPGLRSSSTPCTGRDDSRADSYHRRVRHDQSASRTRAQGQDRA